MTQDNNWNDMLKRWLPLAVTILIVSGLVYAAGQQVYRQSANDPQVQVAEDVVNAITAGSAAADSIVPPNPTADMTQSLSTFLAVYSATGTPLGSSVQLDGQVPVPPSKVFDAAKKDGQNRLTWQPKPGVRVAAVVLPYGGENPGFVLVGRSLREVERREADLLLLCAVAALVGLAAAFFATMFATRTSQAAGAAPSSEPEKE